MKEQILQTGSYSIIKKALPEKNILMLREISNRLTSNKSRPIYIARERTMGENMVERYRSAGLKTLLNKARPLIRAILGQRWLILTNKVILRRTWPMSEKEARELGHNASNLTWHQDSNQMHGNRPMVVMMVCLQDGAGLTRPGLSILDSSTNKFEGVFGYEGNRVHEFEQSVLKQQGNFKKVTPIMNSGDLLIFNGLTFHRTFSQESMEYHRDALLIRLIKPEDAQNFPKSDHIVVQG